MNENNSNKRRIVLALILVATITISILATTAYFITQGRVVEERLTVKTGTLALTFEDNDDGVNEQLMLGETVTKEFIIRNTGNQPVTTNMLFDSLVNTYLEESLSYKLEYKTSETGDWTSVTTTSHETIPHSPVSNNYNLATDLTIPDGETYYYRLTIKLENLDINQEQDRTAKLTTKFKIGDQVTEEFNVTRAVIAMGKGKTPTSVKTGNPIFTNAATTDEGVYSMEDDYGTSYYFRGAVENNYMKFGGFYWRIIRINGDGSVRMQYDGTQAYPNANDGDGTGGSDRFAYTGKVWNTNYGDAKYAGWMFGGKDGESSNTKIDDSNTTEYASDSNSVYNKTNSDIKDVVDTWYDNNIIKNAANNDTDLSIYLGDEIFCNDRTTPGVDVSGWSSDTGKGFGINPTSFGAHSRFVDETNSLNNNYAKVNIIPKFTCEQKNDKFTISDTVKGNGSLTRKIGLITADEIVTAGSGKFRTTNKNYYLFKNSSYWYWTFSPEYMSTSGGAAMMVIGIYGDLSTAFVDNANASAVAPVINISADYAKTLIGNGTMTSPYQIPGVE